MDVPEYATMSGVRRVIFRKYAFWLTLSIGLGSALTIAVVALGGNSTSGTVSTTTGTDGPILNPSVLRSQRTASDVLSPELQRNAESLSTAAGVPNEAQNGRIYTGLSRRALANVGHAQRSAYVVPSEKGGACLVWSDGLGGCAGNLTNEHPISMEIADADGFGRGAPTLVDGVVAETVGGVSVEIDGAIYKAHLENSVYYYETDGIPTAVVVVFTDGHTKRFEFPKIAP